MGDLFDEGEEEEEGDDADDEGSARAGGDATRQAASDKKPSGSVTKGDELLRYVLHSLRDGAFSGEALLSHVGLGGCFLLTTDQRVVYIRRDAASKSAWEPSGTPLTTTSSPSRRRPLGTRRSSCA